MLASGIQPNLHQKYFTLKCLDYISGKSIQVANTFAGFDKNSNAKDAFEHLMGIVQTDIQKDILQYEDKFRNSSPQSEETIEAYCRRILFMIHEYEDNGINIDTRSSLHMIWNNLGIFRDIQSCTATFNEVTTIDNSKGGTCKAFLEKIIEIAAQPSKT